MCKQQQEIGGPLENASSKEQSHSPVKTIADKWEQMSHIARFSLIFQDNLEIYNWCIFTGIF